MKKNTLDSAVNQPTIFVVEDDPIVCDSLKWLFDSVSLKSEFFPDAQNFLNSYDPRYNGCLLIDIRLPGMNGLKLQEELVQRKSTLPIIIMTGHGDVTLAVRAMKLGAKDFILKPFNNESLLEQIQKLLTEDFEKQKISLKFNSLLTTLTTRESQIMELVIQGMSNKQIAANFSISISTVEQHRAHLMQKMEAKSAIDLVRNYMISQRNVTF